MSTDVVKQPEEGPAQDVQAPRPVSRFTRWFRSPLFNVIVVGLISFTQPGIWNALNSRFPCVLLGYDRAKILTASTRHWRWRAAGTLSGQRVQCPDIRDNGLWVFLICDPGEQDRPEQSAYYRHTGLCALLSIIIREQPVRFTARYTAHHESRQGKTFSPISSLM